MYHTRLHVICNPEFSEILIAEIAEAGFDSFLETAEGFEAYVEEERFDRSRLDEIRDRYIKATPIVYSFDKIQKQNWNADLERS